MSVIETERLVLRPWEDTDAPALFELARDPEVGPRAGWPPHASVQESLDVIRSVLRAPEGYAVCLRTEGAAGEPVGTLVGAIELMNPDSSPHGLGHDEYELGYWAGRPFWGRGYIPEASRALLERARDVLGARAVWLGYYVGNRASARVQCKLGFHFVRIVPSADVPFLGERRDEVLVRLDMRIGNGNAGASENDEARRACELLARQDDPARFLSITEPLKLGRAEVVAAGEDLGVLVRFKRNGAYFAAPLSTQAARVMADLVSPESLVSLADDRYQGVFTGGAEVDAGRYELWVYDAARTRHMELPEGLSLRTLDEGAAGTVEEHYALLSRSGIEDHLRRCWIRGGFNAEGELVGFIGEHDEASMGMLEVFPAFRRRGYAQALEAALIGEFIAAGRVPYCHVAPDNEASRALQRKLGLRRVDTIQCWFRMPAERKS